MLLVFAVLTSRFSPSSRSIAATLLPHVWSSTSSGSSRVVESALQRLRRVRSRHGLRGLAQIHHVIPREHRDHPVVVDAGMHIDCKYNLVLMPTNSGAIRMRPDRYVHDGGHRAYNTFVRGELDRIAAGGGGKRELASLLYSLNAEMRRRSSYGIVPWRGRPE